MPPNPPTHARALRRRAVSTGRAGSEAGYTLVEALTIVIIISILAGIALVTYLGLRSRFQDRRATESLRASEQLAKQVLVQEAVLPDEPGLILAMQEEGRNTRLTIGSDRLRAAGVVSVLGRAVPVPTITFTTRSDSGRCYFLRMDPSGRTDRHSSDPASDADGEYCSGAMFGTADVPTGW